MHQMSEKQKKSVQKFYAVMSSELKYCPRERLLKPQEMNKPHKAHPHKQLTSFRSFLKFTRFKKLLPNVI